MRIRAAVGGVLAVLLLCLALPALAEPGHVIRSCDLMDEPYRDAKVLASLEEGEAIEILKRKGGWFQIAVGEREGWVRMSKVRKGEAAAAPDSGTEAAGVLELASGRAGTGNVVATTGVRGLNEEELKAAQFNEAEIKRLESFVVPEAKARKFAQDGKLVARRLEFLPDPAEREEY